MSLRKQLRARLSLVALGAGAGAVFLSNVLAKRIFEPGQFVNWAYLTSLTTLFFSFSLLGSEQLLVRSAKEQGGTLTLSHQTVRYIAVSFVAFISLYCVFLDGRIFTYSLGAWAVPLLVGIGAMQVVYQLERVRGHLLAAQLALGTWKFALVPCVLLASLVPTARSELAMGGALLVGLLAVLLIFQRGRSKLRLEASETDAGRVFLPFMLSLGLLAALNAADRVIFEKTQSVESFASYVYLTTILVTPFGILASYVGFKEAVKYRKDYSQAGVRRDTARTMVATAVLTAVWFSICFLTRRISGIAFDARLWSILGFLAVIRCGYGVLSAAMGVRGRPVGIYLANLLTALALAAFGYLAVRSGPTDVVLVAGYTAVWTVRFLSYMVFLGPSETLERNASETQLA